MVTLLWKGNEFRISGQEMIKGMKLGGVGKAMGYLSELIIPIIENTPDEEDLREGMEEVSSLFFIYRFSRVRRISSRFKLLMLDYFFLLDLFVTLFCFSQSSE